MELFWRLQDVTRNSSAAELFVSIFAQEIKLTNCSSLKLQKIVQIKLQKIVQIMNKIDVSKLWLFEHQPQPNFEMSFHEI